MFKLIKRLKDFVFPKKVSPSEMWRTYTPAETNIPPEHMSRGITSRYREMNDPTYAAKSLRKNIDQKNKYDIIEDRLESVASHYVSSLYNYPFKWIPLLNQKGELYESLLLLDRMLVAYAPELEEVNELAANSDYDKYIDFNFEDKELEYLKKTIEYFSSEENQEILKKSIIMDKYLIEDIKNLHNRIAGIMEQSKDQVHNRLKFSGYLK